MNLSERSERLNEAYGASDLAEVIRLVRVLALGITRGDQEAAQAGTDEITMGLAKDDQIQNFPAWARVVIKRAAQTFWEKRNVNRPRNISLETGSDGGDPIDLPHPEEDWHPYKGARLEYIEEFFPSEEAYRAFQMRADGKTTEEIATVFGCQPAAMRKRLSRWAKQVVRNCRELTEEVGD